MTSTAVSLPDKSPIETFVGQVLPPDRLGTVLRSLPKHVKPERFERNLVIAIAQHPNLLKCDPVAVFNEVSKAAALGLFLDPTLGEAYLITGWDWKTKQVAPQLRLGYRGMIKMGRQSGEIKTIYAHAVHKNDEFDIELGSSPRIYHKPNFFSDRGELGLYYAVAQLPDGAFDFEPMTIGDIYTIRDRSDAWKAFRDSKIKTTPWATDEGEMSKKTVLRRLLKRMPMSPEMAEALRIDDEDYREVDVAPRPGLVERLTMKRPPMGGQISGFSPRQIAQQLGTEEYDPKTGELPQSTGEAQSANQGEADEVTLTASNPKISENMHYSETAGSPASGQAGGMPAADFESEQPVQSGLAPAGRSDQAPVRTGVGAAGDANPPPSPSPRGIVSDAVPDTRSVAVQGPSETHGTRDGDAPDFPDYFQTFLSPEGKLNGTIRNFQDLDLKYRLEHPWTKDEKHLPKLREIYGACIKYLKVPKMITDDELKKELRRLGALL